MQTTLGVEARNTSFHALQQTPILDRLYLDPRLHPKGSWRLSEGFGVEGPVAKAPAIVAHTQQPTLGNEFRPRATPPASSTTVG